MRFLRVHGQGAPPAGGAMADFSTERDACRQAFF